MTLLYRPTTKHRPALACQDCDGEGRRYTSTYGGSDPDIRDAGECEACSGTGNRRCEQRRCCDDATDFTDDGEAFCFDCLVQWKLEYLE